MIDSLFRHLKPLCQNREDRIRRKELKNGFSQKTLRSLKATDEVMVKALRDIQSLIVACTSRPTFRKNGETLRVLRTLQSELDVIEKAYQPSLIKWLAIVPASPVPLFCKTVRASIETSKRSIKETMREFEDWLCIPEAHDAHAIRLMIDRLKGDPSKLAMFFEVANSFMSWSIDHAEVMLNVYELLAQHAANGGVTLQQVLPLTQLAQGPLLQDETSVKLSAEGHTYLIDKLLLARKSRHYQDFLTLGLQNSEAMPFTRPLKRQTIDKLQSYLATDRFPDSSKMDISDKQEFVHILDFLGISVIDWLGDAMRPFLNLMQINLLPGDKFKLSLQPLVEPKALEILGTDPIVWHMVHLDLSAFGDLKVDQLEEILKNLPHLETLTLPLHVRLTDQMWEHLLNLQRLKLIEIAYSSRMSAYRMVSPTVNLPKTLLDHPDLKILYIKKGLDQSFYEICAQAAKFPNVTGVKGGLMYQEGGLIHQGANKPSVLESCAFFTQMDFSRSPGTPVNPMFKESLIRELPSICRNLEALDVSGLTITDPCLQAFATGCTTLRDLNASDSLITEQTIEILAKKFPLRVLKLNNCPNLTDAAVAKLTSCRTLKSLDLRNCSQLTSSTLQTLTHARFTLHTLHLPQIPVNNQVLIDLAIAHPQLTRLTVSHADEVTDEGMFRLYQSCPFVELNVYSRGINPFITDETVKGIANRCRWLESLHLTNCKGITIESIRFLFSRCSPTLKEISVRGCMRLIKDMDTLIHLARNHSDVKIYQPVQQASMSQGMQEPANLL